MNRTFVKFPRAGRHEAGNGRGRGRTAGRLLAGAALALGSAFAGGLAGCAHGDVPPPAMAQNTEYRLGLEDVVDVQVWKEPALSCSVPVRPDGKITVPMMGDVVAQGRTAKELQAEVTNKLKAYVPDPTVTVIVREVKAGRFYVLGEVAHPGSFPLQGHLTVLEAMAIAGGPTEFARTSKMVVLRPQDGQEKPSRIRVSLDDLVDGRLPPVSLVPGDTVYVP